MAPDTTGTGHDRPLCGAARKQGEEGATCTRPAGWGTDHAGIGACKLHGGATPSHLIAAQKTKAAQAITSLGLRRDINPADALLEEVQVAAGNAEWLRLKVMSLDEDALTWGRVEWKDMDTSGPGAGVVTVEKAGINLWVQLWHAERDRMVRASAEAIKCGLAERMVRLAEHQGALIAAAFRAVLSDPALNLTPEQVDAAQPVIVRELRALAGGETAA